MPRGRPRKPPQTPEQEHDAIRRMIELCEEQGVNPDDTLSEEDVKRFTCLTHADKNMINLIASGYPVKGAGTIIRAIEVKLDRSAPRPLAARGSDANITITVKTLGPEAVVAAEQVRQKADAEQLTTAVLMEVDDDPDGAEEDMIREEFDA